MWTVLRLAMAALTAGAIVAQLAKSIGTAVELGRDVGTTIANFFSFFTILSNAAAAIVLAWIALWYLVDGRRKKTDAEPPGLAVALACVSTYMIITGIVYNTKAPFRPSSWSDLLRPEAKGQVTMPSPLNSGAALIHAATLTGNIEGGWKYYEDLRQNGALAGGGNGDILKSVSGGSKLYGVIVDFMPIREKAKGAPVEFVFRRKNVDVAVL